MLIDRFTTAQVRAGKDFGRELLQFHWDYYSALAFQRARIKERISSSLLAAAEGPFEFSGWQRAVRLKYATDPLSTDGSLRDPGGRFSIGAIDPARIPTFPALYLAKDKATALSELFAQRMDTVGSVSAIESALARPDSIAVCEVRGKLETVINLSHPNRLGAFVDILRAIKVSPELSLRARRLRLPELALVRSVHKLIDALQAHNWREWPMQFDVPSTSQIFGQLVREAGIEGILYASRQSGGDCAVVFPDRLRGMASFVELAGELPAAIVRRRLDGSGIPPQTDSA